MLFCRCACVYLHTRPHLSSYRPSLSAWCVPEPHVAHFGIERLGIIGAAAADTDALGCGWLAMCMWRRWTVGAVVIGPVWIHLEMKLEGQ